MALSIRLTEEEYALVDSYARLHSISLSEAFKRALFEKIEDEYDVEIATQAYHEYLEDPEVFSHDEAWREILK